MVHAPGRHEAGGRLGGEKGLSVLAGARDLTELGAGSR